MFKDVKGSVSNNRYDIQRGSTSRLALDALMGSTYFLANWGHLGCSH